jgi:hypothetical protein
MNDYAVVLFWHRPFKIIQSERLSAGATSDKENMALHGKQLCQHASPAF